MQKLFSIGRPTLSVQVCIIICSELDIGSRLHATELQWYRGSVRSPADTTTSRPRSLAAGLIIRLVMIGDSPAAYSPRLGTRRPWTRPPRRLCQHLPAKFIYIGTCYISSKHIRLLVRSPKPTMQSHTTLLGAT
jgi:hypothetical protein